MVQQITETAFNLDNRTVGPQADAAVVMESGMSREGVCFPQASREGTWRVRERFPTEDRQLFFTSNISILGSVTPASQPQLRAQHNHLAFDPTASPVLGLPCANRFLTEPRWWISGGFLWGMFT